MPNINVGAISASPPTNALIGTSSSTVVSANWNRQGLILTNLATGTIYLGLAGNAAVLNSGIALLPNGGSWTMDEYNFNDDAITAISHATNSILAIQEFIR